MSYRFKCTYRHNGSVSVKECIIGSILEAKQMTELNFKTHPDAVSIEHKILVDGRQCFLTKDRGNTIIYQLKQL